eukprot:s74_g13.t1
MVRWHGVARAVVAQPPLPGEGAWAARKYLDHLRIADLQSSVHRGNSSARLARAERQLEGGGEVVSFTTADGRQSTVVVDKGQLASATSQRAEALASAEKSLRKAASTKLAAQLAACFAPIERRASNFADWYFAYPTTIKLVREADSQPKNQQKKSKATSAARHSADLSRTTPLQTAIAMDIDDVLMQKYERIVLQPELNNAKLQEAFLNAAKDLHQSFCREIREPWFHAKELTQRLHELDDQLLRALAAQTTHLEAPAHDAVHLSLDWSSQLHKVKAVPAQFEKLPEPLPTDMPAYWFRSTAQSLGLLELSLALGVGGAVAAKAAGASLSGKVAGVAASKALCGKFSAPFAAKALGSTAVAGLLAGPLGGAVGLAAGSAAGAHLRLAVAMLQIRTASGEGLVDLNLASFLEMLPAGTHPVRALKQHLHRMCGLPRFRQRLVFLDDADDDGMLLDEDRKLRSGEVLVVLLNFCPASDAQVAALGDAARNGLTSEVENILQRPQDPDLACLGHPTPLLEAAEGGHLEVTRLLLEAKADKDKAFDDDGGYTALLAAAQAGHLEVARLLLEANADMDKAMQGGATPLHIAAETGQVEVARFLLESNADKDKATQDGATPLNIAAETGQLEVARLMLEYNADKDKGKDDGATPFFIAAQEGHLDVARLLLEANADKDKAMHDGTTPLFIAVQEGHLAVARLLLEANVDKDQAMHDGATPLHIAAETGQVEVARLLLEADADTDKATREGATPLFSAAQNGQLQVARLLLEANAGQDKATQDGATPLHIAAETGQLEVARLMLESNADKDKAMHDGATPLCIAARSGQLEVARLLLAANANLDKAMHDGATPLLNASYNGQLEVARLLLGGNADMNKATQDGSTPLFVATQRGHLGLARLLQESDAQKNKRRRYR